MQQRSNAARVYSFLYPVPPKQKKKKQKNNMSAKQDEEDGVIGRQQRG
jgi:hypothetical protein